MQVLDPDAARAVLPRPAATTLVVRDGASGLEVLMVRRSAQARFMPGSYVFPGGAVDEADASPAHEAACDEDVAALAARIGRVTRTGEQALALAVAALRECFEECGLWLGAPPEPARSATDWALLRARLHGGESLAQLASGAGLPLATRVLQPWSRWVTPFGVPRRFDTLFFVAPLPPAQQPEVDAGETTELAWVSPVAALADRTGGGLPMEYATVRIVESLQPFGTRGCAALLAHAAAQTALPPVHPRLVVDGDRHVCGVLLPGQAGYEQAYAAARDR